MESNTPQILLLAFLLGGGITAVGARAGGLDRLIRQGDAVGLLMTENVSRLVPAFAGDPAVYGDRQRQTADLRRHLGRSDPVGAGSVLAIMLGIAYVSRRKGVKLSVLLKKLWPAFTTAVRTGSLDAGYGKMEQDSISKLGIERHFATVSLPYGLVLLMPANVIGTLMFTLFAAARYQVPVSAGWLLAAMVLSVVLFVATPPVPGANLLAYIMIFAELQIPSTALIDAMIFDILLFCICGRQQSLLQMD